MNDFDDLTSRLEALGSNPVPPPVATQHLTAMAEASTKGGGGLTHKIRVAAAFGIGILVGGTGLGYAAAHDVLPEAAENAVVDAGKAVGLDLAPGQEKKAEKLAARDTRKAAKGADDGEGEDGAKGCRGAIVSEVAKNKAADAEGNSHGKAVKQATVDAKQACPSGAEEGEEGEEGELDEPKDDTAKEDKAKGPKDANENKPETPVGPDNENQPVDPPAPSAEQNQVPQGAGDTAEEQDPAGPPDGIPPVETPDNANAVGPNGAGE